MTPRIQAFFDPATSTVSYIVADLASGEAAIIDPVLDFDARSARVSTASADAVLAALARQDLRLTHVLETHAHADHLSAAAYLRRKTGATIVIGAHIRDVQETFIPLFEADDLKADGAVFGRLVEDGDTIPLGQLAIRVMHTPGHTPACVTYLVEDAAFVGDTLFMPDYGTARADFPGGDAAELYRSIHKILALPGATRIFVGHDYLPPGRDKIRWETTVAEQLAQNIHIHEGVSEDAFVAMRQARDATLAAPNLILPSLQVNIRGGEMPPASPGGHIFLRLPVNAL